MPKFTSAKDRLDIVINPDRHLKELIHGFNPNKYWEIIGRSGELNYLADYHRYEELSHAEISFIRRLYNEGLLVIKSEMKRDDGPYYKKVSTVFTFTHSSGHLKSFEIQLGKKSDVSITFTTSSKRFFKK